MIKIPQLTIYLAGHSKETYYRTYVKKKYSKLNLIDPMEIQSFDLDKLLGKQNVHTFIVRRDHKLILESDILVAYIKIGSTFGTTMEISFAKSNNIPVYIIDTGKFREDIWLRYYTDKFFDTIDDCFENILAKE